MSRRNRAIVIGVYLLVLAIIAAAWIAYGRRVGAGMLGGAIAGFTLGYAEGIFAAIGIMDDER